MNNFIGDNTVEALYDYGDFQDWILDQDDYWVDAWGNRHVLEEMPRDYLLNVLLFLHERFPFQNFKLDRSPLVERLRQIILYE